MGNSEFQRTVLARLIRTPQPYPDESLNGFLLRVAESNGFDGIGSLLAQAEAPLTVATTPTDLAALSNLLKVNVEVLQRMTYWPMAKRPTVYRGFRGVELRSYHTQVDPCRICPGCLKEGLYCRAVWDIRLASVCPMHGTTLLDRCHDCQEPISWRRRCIAKCDRCQADYRAAGPVLAGNGAVALSHAIYNSVGIEHGADSSPIALPPFIDTVPAIQLLDFIKYLGSYGLAPHGEAGRVRLPRRKPGHLEKLLEASSRALANWPAGFHELLDHVRESNVGRIDRTGLSGQFGDFYITLMRKFSSGHMKEVKEAFLDYIAKDGGQAFATKRGFKYDLNCDRNFMTRPEVAEYLGVASQTVDVLHREGEIDGNTHPMGMTRTHGIFDRASVEAYSDRRRNVIESRVAAARMGLSTVTFRQLIDGGLLEPVARATFRPRKAYEVDERKVDELLQKLDKVATVFQPSSGTTYYNATVRLGTVGLSGVDLIKNALATKTRIMVARETAAGLRRYLFGTSDIDELIAEYSAKLPARMVLVEAADELQIEPRHVARLVGQGALRSRVEKGGTRSIPRSELSRFRSRYVSIRELARQQGRPAQYLLDTFCGSGGRPLLGRSLGISNTFLDRQAALQVFGDLLQPS